MTQGTKFSHGDKAITPPRSGYFEIFNKAAVACAVKVQVTGCNPILELSKPTFTIIHPNASVHGQFDPNIPGLYVIVIENYPVRLNEDSSSHFVSLPKFRDFAIYKVECKDKNVLLKYKGVNAMETRQGGSLVTKLPGFISVAGSDKTDGASSCVIDFQTNILHIERVESSTVS